jgi:hypothetical protein
LRQRRASAEGTIQSAREPVDLWGMEILMTAVGGVLGAGSRVYGRVLRRRFARHERRYIRHDRRLAHVAERF